MPRALALVCPRVIEGIRPYLSVRKNTMARVGRVYSIHDPNNHFVYVGSTENPNRFQTHQSLARADPLCCPLYRQVRGGGRRSSVSPPQRPPRCHPRRRSGTLCSGLARYTRRFSEFIDLVPRVCPKFLSDETLYSVPQFLLQLYRSVIVKKVCF